MVSRSKFEVVEEGFSLRPLSDVIRAFSTVDVYDCAISPRCAATRERRSHEKLRERLSVAAVGVELGVVALALRTENALHFWVVVKQGKKD